MNHMSDPSVVHISNGRTGQRERMRRMRDLAAAAHAAAHVGESALGGPATGRAWLNGVELGRTEARYAHLTRAYE
jgi:hypothetical protein